MWLPATPAYTVRISTPAIVCAASIASEIARTVQSMFETTPLRSPRHGTLPTPRMVMPSASTSPTTADTFVVPMSRPTTISVVSIRLFMRIPARANERSTRRRGEPGMPRSEWPSSSHPHHHALGVSVVVEKDHRRVRLPATDLVQDARGPLDLVAVRGLAEVERDGL